jgi:DNA-directed RNA polymerase, mitochondrial
VERKTVKQTVMTSVYGVTYIGARDQIMNRFKEKYVPHVYSKDEAYFLARYLTPKVFDALDNMFQGARRIQDWLAEAARQISYSVPAEELERVQRELPPGRRQQQALLSHRRACVTWTTPLGLTVVQPYRKSKSYSISTALQTFTLKAQSSDTPVDAQRQIAGFPPNFIHSLDATHMLMTANECAKQEDPIDFAAVHDSYWTHPSDIERLRRLLKEQFVALHSQPIMENLERELHERFGSRRILNVYTKEQWEKRQEESQTKDGDNMAAISPTRSSQIVQAWEPISLPPLPSRGDFDVKEVLQSEYFFS